MRRRVLSVLIVMIMTVGLFTNLSVQSVSAAMEITDENVFFTYPTYLSNSDIDEAESKAEAACYKVLNSYTDSDQAVATAMTILSSGVSIALKQGLSGFGITDAYYEENLKSATKKYMKAYLNTDDAIAKATKKVTTPYKELKSSLSLGESVSKEALLFHLQTLAADNDISLSSQGMTKVVNKIYDSNQINIDLSLIDDGLQIWELALEMTELAAIELSSLDFLMDELAKSGQTNSDLYYGLQLIKADINMAPELYVIKTYGTKQAISFISKNIDKLFGLVVSGTTVGLVKTLTKFYADYIYADAKADQIVQSTMHMSFISSIDIAFRNTALNFCRVRAQQRI